MIYYLYSFIILLCYFLSLLTFHSFFLSWHQWVSTKCTCVCLNENELYVLLLSNLLHKILHYKATLSHSSYALPLLQQHDTLWVLTPPGWNIDKIVFCSSNFDNCKINNILRTKRHIKSNLFMGVLTKQIHHLWLHSIISDITEDKHTNYKIQN